MAIGKLYQAPVIVHHLNERLTWEQLDPATRGAFRGPGKKVKLRAGFRLYKLTAWDIASGDPPRVTPWWSSLERYEWDASLQDRLALARRLGTTPAELTRVVAAVRTGWNPLTHVLTAFLLKDVYAFWGAIGWQPRIGDREPVDCMRIVNQLSEDELGRPIAGGGLVGGAGQFFIPGLTRDVHIRRGVRVPVDDVVAGRVRIF